MKQETSNNKSFKQINLNTMMQFELPQRKSIIKVSWRRWRGSNAVNHMFHLGIKGVDFIICNTDKQALAKALCLIKSN